MVFNLDNAVFAGESLLELKIMEIYEHEATRRY